MSLFLQAFLCLFLCFNLLFAQPILTAGNSNPQIGDRYWLKAPLDLDIFDPGSSGPNVIWDFSLLALNTTDSFEFVWKAPNALPNSNLYPSANVGYELFFLENYYLVNADSFTFVGGGYYEENFSDNPRKLLLYPFTYNDSFVDDFNGPVPSSGNDSIRYGTTLVKGDAYGTLILPFGSFSNMLRVKTEATYIDSSVLGVFQRYSEIRYQWFKPGIHFPLLNYQYRWTDNETLTFYSLLDPSLALNIDQVARDLSLSIFPNPVSDQLNITYTLKEQGETIIRICDMVGRELMKKEFYRVPGLAKESINVSQLEAGSYLLTLTIGNKHLSQKIIIY